MCRWTAYFGDEPVLLEDLLINPKHSLCKQVHDHYLPGLVSASMVSSGLSRAKVEAEADVRNRLFNVDGVGIGFYSDALSSLDASNPSLTGAQPSTYRTVRPPLNDLNLRNLARNTASKVVLGHIRMAESVVVETNNHPFTFGRWLFQHNGSVGNFKTIHRAMIAELSEEAWGWVKGTTDSEVMAALFFTYLTASSTSSDSFQELYSMTAQKEALFKTLKTIEDLQHKYIKEEKDFVPSDLNICITSGSSILTLRYRPSKLEDPPSLYYSTTAGVLINRKFKGDADGPTDPNHPSEQKKRPEHEHAKHVVIGSEPTTFQQDAWTLIPNNSVCFVEELGGDVVVEKVPGW